MANEKSGSESEKCDDDDDSHDSRQSPWASEEIVGTHSLMMPSGTGPDVTVVDVDLHRVAAVALGSVHRGVGAVEQLVE